MSADIIWSTPSPLAWFTTSCIFENTTSCKFSTGSKFWCKFYNFPIDNGCKSYTTFWNTTPAAGVTNLESKSSWKCSEEILISLMSFFSAQKSRDHLFQFGQNDDNSSRWQCKKDFYFYPCCLLSWIGNLCPLTLAHSCN